MTPPLPKYARLSGGCSRLICCPPCGCSVKRFLRIRTARLTERYWWNVSKALIAMVTCLRTRQHTQVNLCKYLAAPRRHHEQQLFPKRSYTWPTFPESPYPGAILSC